MNFDTAVHVLGIKFKLEDGVVLLRFSMFLANYCLPFEEKE